MDEGGDKEEIYGYSNGILLTTDDDDETLIEKFWQLELDYMCARFCLPFMKYTDGEMVPAPDGHPECLRYWQKPDGTVIEPRVPRIIFNIVTDGGCDSNVALADRELLRMKKEYLKEQRKEVKRKAKMRKKKGKQRAGGSGAGSGASSSKRARVGRVISDEDM